MISYRQARSQIISGKLSPVYLIFGEEPFLKEELIALLKERFLGKGSVYGYEKLEGDSVSLPEALARLQHPDLFASRKLLVLDQPPGLVAPRSFREKPKNKSKNGQDRETDKQWDPLWLFLEQEKASPPSSILVLLAAAVDRRRRWFKLLDEQAVVVECAPIKGGELRRWIIHQVEQAGKKIEQEALDLILLEGDNNLWHIYNELQKFIACSGEDQPAITLEIVEDLQAVDSPGNVFKLTDSLAEGDGSAALDRLNRLLRHREPPLKILFMITRHFRLLLETCSLQEAGTHPRQLAGELKVHPFVAQKLHRQASFYSRQILEEIMLGLHDCDLKIKTGQIDPEQALKITLGWICSLHPQNTAADG